MIKPAYKFTSQNVLLKTDVYKMGHMEQYVPGCNKVYSYMQARTNRKFNQSVFFGLQYYLKHYLAKPISPSDVEEFLDVRKRLLGFETNSSDVIDKMRALGKLGYWPLKIKAVPEGTVMPIRNVLMTITNTIDEFYWCVGFVESLLLKLWYPISVATMSYEYKKLINSMYKKTVDDDKVESATFMVHDFGYRGDTSEESAIVSGLSHLLCFKGSDTVVAYNGAIDYYNYDSSSDEILFTSVPASEHSVMCSFGKDREINAFKHMLNLYPTGIVSIVSDTYDIYNVVTNFAAQLREQILSRDGVTVFRPDSGNPEYIICGDPNADPNSNEGKGCIRLLEEMFGSSVNSKGYKVLNPKVSLIYGDGMYLERYEKILNRLENMGYAASNLCIGIGGILRFHSRDTLGFAIKATKVEVNHKEKSIMKDPITDTGKKSHTGYLKLDIDDSANTLAERFITFDNVTRDEEKSGYLRTVFENGKLCSDVSIGDVRKEIEYYVNRF